MTVYIRSSVNCYADIRHIKDLTDNDLSSTEILENLLDDINQMAINFNVFVEIECINEGNYVFTIHNKHIPSGKCIYGYEAFEMDLGIEDDNTFKERVESFLFKFNQEEKFEQFHGLKFSDIAKRHFVTT